MSLKEFRRDSKQLVKTEYIKQISVTSAYSSKWRYSWNFNFLLNMWHNILNCRCKYFGFVNNHKNCVFVVSFKMHCFIVLISKSYIIGINCCAYILSSCSTEIKYRLFTVAPQPASSHNDQWEQLAEGHWPDLTRQGTASAHSQTNHYWASDLFWSLLTAAKSINCVHDISNC